MSEQSPATSPPSGRAATAAPPVATVRLLSTPAARGLADLAGIFDELRTVLRCCERLVAELGGDPVDGTTVEALWTTAVLSYARCFATGTHGVGLTEDDLTGLSLRGDLLEWHAMLRRLPGHYADPAVNPRERFSVGVSLGPDGGPAGVALTSIRQPMVDERTVRQTGAVAYALSGLVDERITAQLRAVSSALETRDPAELAALPLVEVAQPGEEGTPAGG